MSDIFISYSRADRPRAKPLADALRKLGWSVWWDFVIRPGQRFDQVIEAALDEARCVIVLWSRHSIQSRWVRNEAGDGLRRGILVPGLLDDVKIPLEFRGIQAANLIDWSDAVPNTEFDGMVLAISAVLSEAASHTLEATPHSAGNNFLIAVGGSGAKLMHSLIHLAAAGMLPANSSNLTALLVDPDENNGNIEECQNLEETYQACRQLRVGNTDLFRGQISIAGPWNPVPQPGSLKDLFNYDQLANNDSDEAQLMDLFFERDELEMPVEHGFRGHLSVGAAVFANSVTFERSAWKDFRTCITKTSAAANPHILFAGSVFGGSGAAGAPTC